MIITHFYSYYQSYLDQVLKCHTVTAVPNWATICTAGHPTKRKYTAQLICTSIFDFSFDLILMNILEQFPFKYLGDLYPLKAFYNFAAHFSHLEIPAVKELGFWPLACLC